MADIKHVEMYDAVKWHASHFYPDEEQIVADLLASGEDFKAEGNAKKTDIYIELEACANEIRCCVTVGTDYARSMIDNAVREVNTIEVDALTEKQANRIFNDMQQGGVITVVMSAVTIPRSSTLDEVKLVLDELGEDAYEELDRNLELTMAIVREVLGLMEDAILLRRERNDSSF